MSDAVTQFQREVPEVDYDAHRAYVYALHDETDNAYYACWHYGNESTDIMKFAVPENILSGYTDKMMITEILACLSAIKSITAANISCSIYTSKDLHKWLYGVFMHGEKNINLMVDEIVKAQVAHHIPYLSTTTLDKQTVKQWRKKTRIKFRLASAFD